MDAVPEGKGNEKQRRTRREILEANKSPLLDMPKVEKGEYVLKWLFEVGPVQSGIGPLNWQEITAWARLTETVVLPDEAKALKVLSSVYWNGIHEFRDEKAVPPYAPENGPETIDRVRASVEEQIKRMIKKAPKK